MTHIDTNELDVNQPIVDNKGKPTPYFESFLYEVVQGLINFGIDQEAGEWTPELWDGSASTDPIPPTYTRQVGTYTKLRDIVHVQGRISTISLGGLTGTEGLRLGGLPFPTSSTANNFSAMSFGFAQGLNITAGLVLSGHFKVNSNFLDLVLWDLSSGTSSFLVSEFSSNGDIMFAGTYKANA